MNSIDSNTDVNPSLFIVHESKIISGYKRGYNDLGIPTANISIDDTLNSLKIGIYFGYCKLNADPNQNELDLNNSVNNKNDFPFVYPMVMYIGLNPFYKNNKKSAEVHILQEFKKNFYGSIIKFIILGFIRSDSNFTSKSMYMIFFLSTNIFLEELIDKIKNDIDVANNYLKKKNFQEYKNQF